MKRKAWPFRRRETPRLRVVAVIAYSEIGGDPRVLREANDLAVAGYSVEAIGLRKSRSPRSSQRMAFDLREVPMIIRRGGILRYLYQYGLFFILSMAALARIHVKRRIQLIYVHSLPDFQVFCTLPFKAFGVPVVLDLHESLPELFQARFALEPCSVFVRLAVVAQTLSARFADRVVAATDSIRDLLVSRGVAPDHIAVVYNSADGDDRTDRPAELRARLGLPTQRLIVHAGGINEERDLDTLVLAFAKVAQMVDSHLILAGDGNRPYIDRLLSLASRLGVRESVHYVGRLSPADAHALMALSEVGVVTLASNPHSQIAWPARIGEFINLGKPLVVPEFAYLRGVLGDAASYYTPGDSESLARALIALTANPAEMEASSLRLRRISTRFAPETNRAKLLDACMRLTLACSTT